MQQAQLEVALLALDRVLDQEDEVEMSWKLSLERAQRQYDLAEPENRLVVRSLEGRWNEKLVSMNNLREEYDRYRANRSWRPTARDREDILALAKDLPRIWNAPTTEAKDRKRIVRLLIEDVTVNCLPCNKDVSLGLRWRNNFCEVLHVTKPLPHHMMRKHTAETVEIIGTLAHNLTDNEVAKYLNDSATVHRKAGFLFAWFMLKFSDRTFITATSYYLASSCCSIDSTSNSLAGIPKNFSRRWATDHEGLQRQF